ncbi:WD domain, G-beta repeat [Rhizoctonia solani]|uniref:WD domain, G-beta repeat n=1 Tax=Rhizoctonia solani TaxID=456999 RepID=A0A8H7IKD5_9AGAM|nr:WD domain, G-beta repeat [Rhizoctonia solani]
MTLPTSLPQVTIQADAFTAIEDVEQGVIENEDIWISCYDSSMPSVHGKVAVMISDEDRTQCAFKGRDGVQCERIQNTIFAVSCPALHIDNRSIHFPTHVITLPEVTSTKTSSKLDKGINNLDISPDGQLWVAALGNGSVLVGAGPSKARKDTPAPLEGNYHKGAVSTVQLVKPTTSTANPRILSGSEDFSLRTNQPDAPSPQHSSDITHSLRNLGPGTSMRTKAISAGRDGTLRVWDLTPESTSVSRQIGMVRSNGDVAINSFALSFGHSASLAVLALQSGHFDLVDVDSRNTLFSTSSAGFEYTRNGPLDAIDIYPLYTAHKYLVATGSQRGVISFFICTIDNGSVVTTNLGSCIRNGAGISDVKFIPLLKDSIGKWIQSARYTPSAKKIVTDAYPRLLVATTDGLPYQLQISQKSDSAGVQFQVTVEYAGGADCSPLRSIVWHDESKTVWVAGDDGVIWIY